MDIENFVIDTVTNAVQQAYPSVVVYSEYVNEPESFPCVFIVEADNSVVKNFICTTEIEFATDVMYEINIYTNKPGTRKTEAKQIASVVDSAMKAMGMRRTMLSQVPNADTGIYRMVGRYTGRVSLAADGEDKHYRITIH